MCCMENTIQETLEALRELSEVLFDPKVDEVIERMEHKRTVPVCLQAERVIFSKPATIVLWKDGTRTVVKCDKKDKYSQATGLALCYMKKALGNTSRGLNDALRDAKDRAVVEHNADKGGKK